jgi:hypothetical protein
MGRIVDVGTKQGRWELVQHFWPTIAGLAYEKYLESGRGFMVLSQNNPNFPTVSFKPGRTGDNVEIDRILENYDPERQLVCLFLDGEQWIGAGLYAVPEKPPLQMYVDMMRARGRDV